MQAQFIIEGLKDLGKILVYFLATILLGALLAPPLFAAGQHFAMFADTGFQRFFNRAILIAAVALLFPLAISLRIRGRHGLALRPNPHPIRDFVGGFLIACITTAILGAVLVFFHFFRLKAEFPWGKLAFLPLTAVTVAVIEEAFFRGALQGVIQRTLDQTAALVFVACLFSIIHFLKPPESEIEHVTWVSGFTILPKTFSQFTEPALLAGGFVTLLLVGLILGYARRMTQSLWMPIGLHAGWIVGKMGFSKITKRLAEPSLWVGKDLLVGFGPVLMLLLTAMIVFLYLRNERAHHFQDRR